MVDACHLVASHVTGRAGSVACPLLGEKRPCLSLPERGMGAHPLVPGTHPGALEPDVTEQLLVRQFELRQCPCRNLWARRCLQVRQHAGATPVLACRPTSPRPGSVRADPPRTLTSEADELTWWPPAERVVQGDVGRRPCVRARMSCPVSFFGSCSERRREKGGGRS